MDQSFPPHSQEIADDNSMATLVAPPVPPVLDPPPPPPAQPTPAAAASGVNKRYRPAPAKTFQCRGYGDCRMVFSRSEHLARHIRKHTGERPFSCHCSKQFSRLDNLRQHAQTVHADKQELNDKMMRDLTSLHTSMSAASKGGGSVRTKRGSLVATSAANATSSSSPTNGDSSKSVKQEDTPSSIPPISSQHPRPGTSTGYEGDNGIILYQHIQGSNTWHIDSANPRLPSNPRPPSNYSFRDPINAVTNQSFRVSPNYQYLGQYPAGQSFLVPAHGPSTGSPRLGSNHLGSPNDARSLPPLAAVVRSSLATPPPPPAPAYVLTQHPPPSAAAAAHILPLPNPTIARRPATSASRPTTAPAAYYPPPGSAYLRQLPFRGSHGHRLGFSSAELSIPVYGGGKLGLGFGYGNDAGPTSPTSGESPFSFHPPALAEPQSSANPRKRPFPGSDDGGILNGNTEYEYGTESRPQSRRLTVLELCNDTDVPPPRTASGESRPGSRAVLSTLDERLRPSSVAVLAGDKTAGGPDASDTSSTVSFSDREHESGGAQESTGRRIPQAFRDSKHLSAYTPSSPVFSSSGSTIKDSTVSPRQTPTFGTTSRIPHGVARTGASNSGSGPESPGNGKVRITAGFAPVGMKA